MTAAELPRVITEKVILRESLIGAPLAC